jgi:hypothetical protein
METLFEILDARNETKQELAHVALRMIRGKASMRQVEAILQELDDSSGKLIGLLETRLWDMGIEFDDEKVIAALTDAKEVLTYVHEHECVDLSQAFAANSTENDT